MSVNFHLSVPLSCTIFASAFGLLVFLVSVLRRKRRRAVASLPEVPGWPVLGNLLQLKEKKPHKTFVKWAEIYGPIYSIKLGACPVVVLNSTSVAKEAMVTRFSSISTRKLSKALGVLSQDKSMVAMSDFDDFHKMVKRHLLASVAGPRAQKRLRVHRDVMMENLSSRFHHHVDEFPGKAVDFREIFESELFFLSLKEALGTTFDSVFVPEFHATISTKEIFTCLVNDLMEGAIDVDWRDFFPFLSWIPNRNLEKKIELIHFRREAVMVALINEQKKQFKDVDCYLNYLQAAENSLTEKQIRMLVWEVIIEGSDTTVVVTEWAMFELAKNPDLQDRLYEEIQQVCGSEILTEDHLPKLPFLNAILHETLRKYSPVPVIPLRYVHEDTELGGYHVPAGSEIAVNIYGCNMDKTLWEEPEEWKPERFLNGKYVLSDLHKTMAFGAGKRACAGSLQAQLIGCWAIGRLVQEFEWRLIDGEEGNVDTSKLTTKKLHPLQAVLLPRRVK